MSESDLVKRDRELLVGVTEGPWYRGHNPLDQDPLEYLARAYSYGPPGLVHLVCVPFEDKPIDEEALFTAVTGNGPSSEANATFIAASRTLAPELLEALEAAEAERARLREALRNIAIQDDEVDEGELNSNDVGTLADAIRHCARVARTALKGPDNADG